MVNAKGSPLRTAFQSVKKVRLAFCVSCGSTHKIEFAKQIHKFREHVSRNLYKGRKNVPVRARFFFGFARKRGFEREAARKTLVFRQPQRQSVEDCLFASLQYRTKHATNLLIQESLARIFPRSHRFSSTNDRICTTTLSPTLNSSSLNC